MLHKPNRTRLHTEPNFFTTETPFKHTIIMDIEKYLDKTDLILYNKIIKLIYRDWDTLDSSTLSDLMDKLRELHQNLDSVILQKKQHDLFTKEYYKSNFDRGSVKESVDLKSISLSKMIPHSQSFRRQLDKRV